uniref:Terpenoid synthase n=1 Tax=Moniliophthora roreri TaxID=221103 RepID=A0A0W0FSY1_MONRR
MSILIDTNLFPECFGSFPVRVHKDEPQVAAGSDATLKMFERLVPEKDSRSHAIGPYGDAFAMSYPEGDTEKTKLSAEIIQALWMYDDITETLPHEEAVLEHATVKKMFVLGDREANGTTPGKKTLMTSIFRDVAARMKALDPEGAPWIIGNLHQYLTEYDGGDKIYSNVEDYAAFRSLNVGYRIMSSFMQWCLSIYLSDGETELCKDFYAVSSRVMALTNDYWSWDMEKKEATDRVRNVIPVVMKQYSMSEKDARTFVKGMIIDVEQTTWKLGLDLKKGGSETIKRYVDGTFLLLGGSGFWSSTSPRYNSAQE